MERKIRKREVEREREGERMEGEGLCKKWSHKLNLPCDTRTGQLCGMISRFLPLLAQIQLLFFPIAWY